MNGLETKFYSHSPITGGWQFSLCKMGSYRQSGIIYTEWLINACFIWKYEKVKKMYCTELDKYCNEITDEECDGCCDTCIFCDTYYDAEC